MKRVKLVSLILALILACSLLSGCSGGPSNNPADTANVKIMSHEDAITELNALLTKVSVSSVNAPLDIYDDVDDSGAAALADLSTFPITVQGNGQINIEIAAATEMSSDSPDDWLNVVARNYNRENHRINGKTVSVTVRKITSGEVVTYMMAGKYKPEMYIPSNYAWGKMLEDYFKVTTLTDRLIGNTAGILMKKDTYDQFVSKYEEVTVGKVLQASVNGDLVFAYTNPYTSSTGLNILCAMLNYFDPDNPVSENASAKLIEYQRQSPPVAYTTGVLRNQAAKGIIDAMVMEEQAFINTPELRDYVYTPAGIRHDHPVYTFDYVTEDQLAGAKDFVEYCLGEGPQKLANERGFNLHDDYVSQDPGLSGTNYFAAQKVWKQNKNGGRPIISVFVADASGSMDGAPMNSLKTSLIEASAYIGSENYIGLISYSDNVIINLPIQQFDAKQRAYFRGAIKTLNAGGNTATYDAVLQALKMAQEKKKEIPDAKITIFVLSDGQQNVGTSLSRITSLVKSLGVPVYTIGYNLKDTTELSTLATLNEATLINASTDDVVNQLRNLFNTQL